MYVMILIYERIDAGTRTDQISEGNARIELWRAGQLACVENLGNVLSERAREREIKLTLNERLLYIQN